MEDRFIIYIIIIDTKMVLEYYTLISILLLVSAWLFNINTIVYIYNNHRLFLIFIFFIKRIVEIIAAFYKKDNISIAWRISIKINYIIDMVNILYIFNLFINLFLILKFRVSGLYIIIKDYII